MAVQQLQIPSSNINNLVDQSTWAGLGNLGNVYREAQDRDQMRASLAQLGTDPTANAAVLLKSGNPALIQAGLRLQQEQTVNKRADAELNIRKAEEARAQGNYDQAEEYRSRAAELNRQLLEAAQGGGAAAPGATTPFPASLPGQTTLPPSAGAPGAAPPAMFPPPSPPPPQTPPAPPAAVPGAPSAWAGTPRMPAGLQPGPAVAPPGLPPGMSPGGLPQGLVTGLPSPQAMAAAPMAGTTGIPTSFADRFGGSSPPSPPSAAAPSAAPPVKAEDTGLPDWAGPQSLAGKMVQNLTSGAPSAAAGISNKLLGEALANPETRELAKVFAQNKLDPGTWAVHYNDNGQVFAFNPKVGVKDITPAGVQLMNKEDRERQSIYNDAIQSGFSPQAALFMKFNKGKPPGESMTPKEIGAFNDLNNTARTADVFVGNLKRMQELSKNAYEGYGAQTAANIGTGVLGEHAPQAAIDTQKMLQLSRENAALQLRSTFGSRPAVVELQYLQQLESNPLMSRPQREDIYKRLIERFSQFSDEDKARAQAIQEGTLYRKGPGNLVAAPPQAPPVTAAAAAPSVSPTNNDLAAAKWARDNPKDPRAQAIMQHLRGR